MREFKQLPIFKYGWMLAAVVAMVAVPLIASAADEERESEAAIEAGSESEAESESEAGIEAESEPESEPEREAELEFAYKKLPDQSRELSAVVTSGDLPIENMLVNFFVGSVGAEGGWGNAPTDENGKAVKVIGADADLPIAEDGTMTFIVRSKHKSLPFLEKRVELKDAFIELSSYEEVVEDEDAEEGDEEAEEGAEEAEEKRFIKAKAYEGTKDNPVPLASTQLTFEIKRSFGEISFGGDFTFTDEEGELSVEFPEGIPADSDGKVEVVVTLEDAEQYGTVVQTHEVPWVADPPIDKQGPERALWANRAQAPWWLLLTVNLMLIGIWGTIVYVLNLTRKISKN